MCGFQRLEGRLRRAGLKDKGPGPRKRGFPGAGGVSASLAPVTGKGAGLPSPGWSKGPVAAALRLPGRCQAGWRVAEKPQWLCAGPGACSPSGLNSSGTAAPRSRAQGAKKGFAHRPAQLPTASCPVSRPRVAPGFAGWPARRGGDQKLGADLPGHPQASRVPPHPEPSREAGCQGHEPASSISRTLPASPPHPAPDVCPLSCRVSWTWKRAQR